MPPKSRWSQMLAFRAMLAARLNGGEGFTRADRLARSAVRSPLTVEARHVRFLSTLPFGLALIAEEVCHLAHVESLPSAAWSAKTSF